MNNASLVSVIIPNYNYARYLRGRIDSVLSQTYNDFEVILLDDCSTDDSRDVIESYRSHPKVSRIVYNRVNSGNPFSQWEAGLQLAVGKYAWIAEADDLADKMFLEKTVEAMEADSGIAAVKTLSRLIDSEGRTSSRKPFESIKSDGSICLYDGREYLRREMIWWNHCYNASMMLLRMERWRELHDKSYVDFRHVGDWLFWSSMIAGHKLAEIRLELNSFRIHEGSVISDARRSALALEGEQVKRRIADLAGGGLTGYRIHNRYQLARLGVRLGCYPIDWLYKHTVWPIEERILKKRHAVFTVL